MSHGDNKIGRRALLLRAGGIASAALLTGCNGLLPTAGPPPRLFRLTPKSTFDDLPQVDWQLLIELPEAPAGLNTTRVALLRDQTELEYYARANWTDRAPSMIQTLIIESFQNSGAIVAVGRESIGLRSDFVLKTELREFQAEYPAGPASGRAPDAHVRLNGILVQMPRRAIIASVQIDRKMPAAADRLAAIVAAFDDALGSALKELVTWTLTTGEATV